jgi:hypothetical protein
VESWRHDADDRERLAFDAHDRAERVRRTREPAGPEVIADHDRALRRRQVVFRRTERAPIRRLHAKDIEVVGRDDLARSHRRLVADRE